MDASIHEYFFGFLSDPYLLGPRAVEDSATVSKRQLLETTDSDKFLDTWNALVSLLYSNQMSDYNNNETEDFEHDDDIELDEDIKFDEDDLIQLNLLRSQEIDEMVDQGFLTSEDRFNEELLETLQFNYPELNIILTTGEWYPAQQLICELENLTLSRLVIDDLRIEIRKLIVEGTAKNNDEAWSRRNEDDIYGVFDFEMTALAIAKKTAEFLDDYKKLCKKPNEELTVVEKKFKYKNDNISQDGIDVSKIEADATASSILGKTPAQMCAEIPSYFRILHVEKVLRTDLYKKYQKHEARTREHLENLGINQLKQHIPKCYTHRCDSCNKLKTSNNRTDVLNFLSSPHMTFHGTSNKYVPSIVQNGFFKPGSVNHETGDKHSVRCGSTYGRGIYSSPSPYFALMYSGTTAQPTSPNGFWGLKLIVCATIMGRSREMFRDDNWREQSTPYEGADSHVAGGGLEYIVFSSAAILPVYVIHLDWGQQNAFHFKNISNDKKLWRPWKGAHPKLKGYEETHAERVIRLEAMKVRAAKHFPFGYGPAGFVVEDIVEVDDDEEEYGDYQKERGNAGFSGEKTNIWDWEDGIEQGELSLDEYDNSKIGY